MNNAINIALSGIRAAVLRTEVATNNIVNAQSTASIGNGKVTNGPFIPQDVVQVPDTNGGTFAYIQNSSKSTAPTLDPTTGEVTQLPNVDLAEELVKIQRASFIYKANLKVVERASNLLGSLTNIST